MHTAQTILDTISNVNILFYIIAYLVGGIPFGMMIVKIKTGKNILTTGSKSIGATNVYRTLNESNVANAKIWSLSTLILDAIKGLIVVLIAKLMGLSYETQWAIAILSVIGHCYSPWIGFHGGKGVSTAIGSVILLMPIEGIIGLIIWGVVGKVFKISSLSSLLGVLCGVILTFIVPHIIPLPDSINIIAQIHSHVPVVIIALIVIYTHWKNIVRLFTFKEKKFTTKSEGASTASSN
ncbi:glycerol-3-phosphate 1-O-acyltransferase PlsY [Helicobacter sp. 11S02629-2]|uniref:glycerol-3-phosphate 1-O-acyltransferase PlsY n=1 Tax=Helicobacter sp. 11S02629-2 TaxID=1476195 RepID=UPI000BA7A7F3|nr:glycerol-3-phosphate 1-O-acyltransferase PlsY [Helicobacter sp. 11S02629-2]PAF45337.1 acyl-phosphate--glycerol-3-phosphate O-acyltransferase [Helicobacter sp. 11S02629-2]